MCDSESSHLRERAPNPSVVGGRAVRAGLLVNAEPMATDEDNAEFRWAYEDDGRERPYRLLYRTLADGNKEYRAGSTIPKRTYITTIKTAIGIGFDTLAAAVQSLTPATLREKKLRWRSPRRWLVSRLSGRCRAMMFTMLGVTFARRCTMLAYRNLFANCSIG